MAQEWRGAVTNRPVPAEGGPETTLGKPGEPVFAARGCKQGPVVVEDPMSLVVPHVRPDGRRQIRCIPASSSTLPHTHLTSSGSE